MTADSYRIIFSKDMTVYIYGGANAYDSFIYKRFADVIRDVISFNTLHLLFTSCIPVHCESRCPSASSIALHSLLSVYLKVRFYRMNIFSCLTSELFSRICEKLPLSVSSTFEQTRILRKVFGFISYLTMLLVYIHTPCSIIERSKIARK